MKPKLLTKDNIIDWSLIVSACLFLGIIIGLWG